MIAPIKATANEQARVMAELVHSALHYWALENAELTLLSYRENAVFKVTDNGRRYAMRAHRSGYHSEDALKSELQWIQALSDAGLQVPAVVPTRTGELYTTRTAAMFPCPVQLDLFDWIEGRQLGSVQGEKSSDPQWLRETWRTLGKLAADLHNHSAAWPPPPAFVRHAWDEDGIAGPEPLWGRFWELPSLCREERSVLIRARDRVYRDLAALPKVPASYSLIHADLLPENVLVDGADLRLIDFDDCGFGWHLFELVTPLYSIKGEPWFEQARDALIAGYRSRRSLDDSRLTLLPLFFLARSLTDVGWMLTRPETETARRSTRMLVESACELAEEHLGADRR